MRRPTRERVRIAQGTYYVVTGVAPFVSRRAFEGVTGPKADWWLVQTVGTLVTSVGAALVPDRPDLARRRAIQVALIAGIAAGRRG